MEVCRRQRRDETLQAYITIASGKSFHHEQGCYRASADPSIGHCLQWQHPKEQHTVLIFGALGALHHSLGEPLETELPWKPQGQTRWEPAQRESRREPWSASHTPSAAGTELCGGHHSRMSENHQLLHPLMCWNARGRVMFHCGPQLPKARIWDDMMHARDTTSEKEERQSLASVLVVCRKSSSTTYHRRGKERGHTRCCSPCLFSVRDWSPDFWDHHRETSSF